MADGRPPANVPLCADCSTATVTTLVNGNYGFDRVMCRSWEDWRKLRDSGYLQHDYHCRCNFPSGYDVGTRWVSPIHSWVPIGFAQLFHGSADTPHGFHQKAYPHWHNSASRSDVQFSLQWDRRKRILLPEVIVLHLESEPSALGANWKGRTTPRFGPGGAPGEGGPTAAGWGVRASAKPGNPSCS